MPSSVVHASLAVLLAIGLLGRYYDRRALAVVLVVLLLPEVDTLLGYLMDGAHRTVLHNYVLTAAAAVLLSWDATREDSWLRGQYGERGVRVAWVALLAHAFAHLGLDWAHLSGINVLWPVFDRFVALDGELYLSTADGFVQTFVEVASDPETGERNLDVGQGGTTRDTHVGSPAQPTREPTTGPVDRRFPIAVQGWQLYVVLAGLFGLVARSLQTPRHAPVEEETPGAEEAPGDGRGATGGDRGAASDDRGVAEGSEP